MLLRGCQVKGVRQKRFCFAGWKCCCFIYKEVLMWVKTIQDVVVLPSQKIISKSLIYLLMFLSSWEVQLAMLYFLHPFFS